MGIFVFWHNFCTNPSSAGKVKTPVITSTTWDQFFLPSTPWTPRCHVKQGRDPPAAMSLTDTILEPLHLNMKCRIRCLKFQRSTTSGCKDKWELVAKTHFLSDRTLINRSEVLYQQPFKTNFKWWQTNLIWDNFW